MPNMTEYACAMVQVTGHFCLAAKEYPSSTPRESLAPIVRKSGDRQLVTCRYASKVADNSDDPLIPYTIRPPEVW